MNVITNGEPRRSYDGRFGSFSSSRKKHSSASTAGWTEQQSSFEDTRPLTAETQRAVVGQPSTMDNIKTGDIGQTSQYPWEQPQGMAAPPGKYSSVKQAPQPIFGTTPDARIAKDREALEKQQPVQSVNDFGGTSKDKFKPTPNDAALAAAAAATGATAGAVATGSAATDTSSYNFPTPKAQTFASPLPEAGVFDLDAAGNSRIITGYDLDDRSVTAKLANRIAALGGPNKPLIDQQPATDADKDVSRAVSGQPQEGPLATTARESREGQDTSNSPSKAGKVAGGAAIGAVGGATAGGIVDKCMQYLRGGEPVSSEEQDALPAANKQPQQPDEGVQSGDTIPATRKKSSAASDEATTGVGAVGSKGPGMRDQMRRQSIPEATGVEPGEGIFAGGQTSGPPPGSCLQDEQSMKPQAATAAPTSSQKDQQDMPGQQQQKGDKYIQDTYVPPGSGKGGMAAAAGAGAGAGAGAATGGALGAATAAGSGPGARQNQMPTSAVTPNNNVYESGEHPQQLAPSTGPEPGLIYDDDAVVRSSAASSPAFEGISKTGEIEDGYDDGWNSREQGSNKAIRGSPVNHEETAPGAWPSDEQQQRGGVAGAAVGGGTALAMQDFDEVKQRSANEYASNKQQPGSWQQQAQQQAHPDTWEEAGMQQQQQQLQSVVPAASMDDVQPRQVGGDSTAATAGGAQGMDQSLPTSQDVHPAEQAPPAPAADNKARGAAAYQQQPAQQDFHPGRGEQPRSPKSSLASLGAAAGVAGGIASGALGIATGKLFGQKKSSRDERQQQEDNKQQPQSRNRRSSASSAQRQAQTPRQRRSSQGVMYAAGTEGVGVAAIGPRGEKGLYGGDSQYQSRHRDSSLPETRQSSVGKVDPAADTIHSSGSNKAATAAPPPSAPQHDTAAETATPNTVSTQQQSTQEDYPTSLQGQRQHQQGIATQNHHASTLGQQQKQQIASDANNRNNNGMPEVLQGATGGVGGGAIGNLSHGELSSKRRSSIKQFFGGDRSKRRSSSSWKDNFNKMFNRKSWNEHQQQQQLGQENMPDFRHQSPARGQQLL